MKVLIVLTCVVTMALAQPGTMPPTRQPTTLMRPTGTVERPTQRPPPDDGTRRDDCDATQEEINNCPCNIMRDDTGCPECPDSCSAQCPPRPNCGTMICLNGFAVDDNGCHLCQCRRREDDDENDDDADTVEEVRERMRCHPMCILILRESYRCNTTCNATRVHMDFDQCDLLSRVCDEASGQTCSIVGEGNVRMCVGLPGMDEECSSYNPRDDGTFEADERFDEDEEEEEEEEEEERRRRPSNSGSDDRRRASFISDSVDECRPGLTCNMNTRCQQPDGPCTQAVSRREATIDQCDDEGNFDVRRCNERQDDGTRFNCFCVRPNNGMQVPNTTRDVEDMRDFTRSDCTKRVYNNCTVTRGGKSYLVSHGDPVITTQTTGRCRVCRCNDGTAEDCQVRDCEPDTDNRNRTACSACAAMPRRPVSGPDGNNYPSMCHAMRCRGFDAEEIADRPSASMDVCSLFPCRDGYSCVRTAGASCTGRCRPSELRTCVDRSQLRSSANTTVEGDDVVCGSDGQSYKSFSHMIQLGPPDVRVRQSGRCDRTDCGSMVCGTDRVTYPNSCEMRTLSANARMDHEGACMSDSEGEMTDQQLCQMTRDNNRCPDISDCTNRIQPREGCCPVCGGDTTITLKDDELTMRKSASGEKLDTDDIMSRLRDGGFISDDTYKDCEVHGARVTTSSMPQIEVSFNRLGQDSTPCRMASLKLADMLNSEDAAVTQPEIASYAAASVAEPLIEGSGAPGLTGSVVGMLAAALFALSMLLF